MMSPAYCQMMARYDAWQHRQLPDYLPALPAAAFEKVMALFFDSVLKTLSCVCWRDWIWLSRLDGSPPPQGKSYEGGISLVPDPLAWRDLRCQLDERIAQWTASPTQKVHDVDLDGYLRALKKDKVQPMVFCAAHFFNHQTHHRGQVHGLLTQTGVTAPVSNLVFMPGEM